MLKKKTTCARVCVCTRVCVCAHQGPVQLYEQNDVVDLFVYFRKLLSEIGRRHVT